MSFVLPLWAVSAKIPPQAEHRGLSPRLSALYDRVPEGARVADIGTDHALLPEALVRAGRVDFAVGVDRAQPPLEAAKARMGGAILPGGTLFGALELRWGEGLAPLRPGEIDCVVLAGFGGKKMVEVLLASRLDELGVHTIVAQPTAGMPSLRRHLAEAGWLSQGDLLIRELDRGFWVAQFQRSKPRTISPWEALVGQASGPELLLRAWLEVQAQHFLRKSREPGEGGLLAGKLYREIEAFLEAQ